MIVILPDGDATESVAAEIPRLSAIGPALFTLPVPPIVAGPPTVNVTPPLAVTLPFKITLLLYGFKTVVLRVNDPPPTLMALLTVMLLTEVIVNEPIVAGDARVKTALLFWLTV